MKAMILAAGRGERLRPRTDTLPKPLFEVRGELLIERHLRRLAGAGFTEVVVNVAWLAGSIETRLGDGTRFGVQIRYSREPAGALETGGGIFQALPLLGSAPFLVVNADVYTEFDFATLRGSLAEADVAHLVMVPNPPEYRNGDFALESRGRLTLARVPRLKYSGIGVHRPAFFRGCRPGRFPLLPLWQQAIQAGRASGELYTGVWHDLGTPAGLRGVVNS
ncbi:MAG: N-acetylmuramate alpha-1-phosphate uridylyltransferase MurU [Gammaproteobacteria bacterium]